MKKMIMMALAGFLWKKFQARGQKPMPTDRPLRRM